MQAAAETAHAVISLRPAGRRAVNGPILFHLVLGIVILLIGVALLRRQKTVVGWVLAAVGSGFAVMGFVMQATHRYLHH